VKSARRWKGAVLGQEVSSATVSHLDEADSLIELIQCMAEASRLKRDCDGEVITVSTWLDLVAEFPGEGHPTFPQPEGGHFILKRQVGPLRT
jgi:hypothetical protein